MVLKALQNSDIILSYKCLRQSDTELRVRRENTGMKITRFVAKYDQRLSPGSKWSLFGLQLEV